LPGGRFSLEPTMTDAEILTLVHKLEQCQLSPADFHHRDHLAVSAAYLYCGDLESALASLRAALQRFIAHHRLKGYHETITRFWMEEIDRRLDRTRCLAEAVKKIQEELGDKNLIYSYYSKQRLGSTQTREEWVEPDLILRGR
jgi:hypothetical protein